MGTSILVVDNEKSICDLLAILFEKEGYEVVTADNGETALSLIKENEFDLVITDIRMPKSGGIDVLKAVNESNTYTPVVMMTAYASAETAVEAMKNGAYDYISKPFNVEDLKLIAKNAIEKKRLREENAYLKTALKDKYQFASIIGRSPSMLKVFDLIRKVSESSATVLIYGESGTGKELVARAIHFNGVRRDHPFISINCGAMPENLLESELFGHERGAFTSADAVKRGLMELANQGSFFFDEVCEAPLSIQVKLLRVLQERECMRVGGTKSIKIDLRVIAATNKDLAQAVKEKKFREDLYYRLNVIPITLPPLRERKEDIPLLVRHFIDKYVNLHQRKTQIEAIDTEALSIIERYHWPGNVRQLENVIERAVVLEKGNLIRPDSLPEEVLTHPTMRTMDDAVVLNDQQPVDLEKTLDQMEKKMIVWAMAQSGGIMNKASKLLNLSFRSMRYRMQKYKIKGKFEVEEEADEQDDISRNS